MKSISVLGIYLKYNLSWYLYNRDKDNKVVGITEGRLKHSSSYILDISQTAGSEECIRSIKTAKGEDFEALAKAEAKVHKVLC